MRALGKLHRTADSCFAGILQTMVVIAKYGSISNSRRVSQFVRGSYAHHRSRLGPSFAPTAAQTPTGNPYQSAMDGSDCSVQGKAQAMAPRPPAARPARAPARIRSVGAPTRRAQTRAVNGRIARRRMAGRHASESFSTIIPGQAEKRADASATAAAAPIMANGMKAKAGVPRIGARGRAN